MSNRLDAYYAVVDKRKEYRLSCRKKEKEAKEKIGEVR
jgi:hypothetical protein